MVLEKLEQEELELSEARDGLIACVLAALTAAIQHGFRPQIEGVLSEVNLYREVHQLAEDHLKNGNSTFDSPDLHSLLLAKTEIDRSLGMHNIPTQIRVNYDRICGEIISKASGAEVDPKWTIARGTSKPGQRKVTTEPSMAVRYAEESGQDIQEGIQSSLAHYLREVADIVPKLDRHETRAAIEKAMKFVDLMDELGDATSKK